MKQLKKAVINTAIIGFISVILFEVCFYFLLSGKYQINLKKRVIFKEDPNIGYILGQPNPNDQEVDADVIKRSANQFGFVGKAYPPTKRNQSALRIITLGGSTTYGVGTSSLQSYPYYLDSIYNANDIDTEVVNLAVAGYTSRHNMENYIRRFKNYDVDILIIGSWFNDMYYRDVSNKGLQNFDELHFDVNDSSNFYRTRKHEEGMFYSILRLKGLNSVYAHLKQFFNSSEHEYLLNSNESSFAVHYNEKSRWIKNYLDNLKTIIAEARSEHQEVKIYVMAMPTIFFPNDNLPVNKIDDLPSGTLNLGGRNYDSSVPRSKFHFGTYYYHNLLFPQTLKPTLDSMDVEIIKGYKAFETIQFSDLPIFFKDEMHLKAKGNELLASYIFNAMKE